MENASKALIIAGAILLSILIITLGLGAYNNAKDQMGNANLSSQEINTHNSQFTTSYKEGTIKGAQLKQLMTQIQVNNNDYEDRKISVYGNKTTTKPTAGAGTSIAPVFSFDTATTIDGVRTEINSNTTYDLEYGYNSNGLILYVLFNIHEN